MAAALNFLDEPLLASPELDMALQSYSKQRTMSRALSMTGIVDEFSLDYDPIAEDTALEASEKGAGIVQTDNALDGLAKHADADSFSMAPNAAGNETVRPNDVNNVVAASTVDFPSGGAVSVGSTQSSDGDAKSPDLPPDSTATLADDPFALDIDATLSVPQSLQQTWSNHQRILSRLNGLRQPIAESGTTDADITIHGVSTASHHAEAGSQPPSASINGSAGSASRVSHLTVNTQAADANTLSIEPAASPKSPQSLSALSPRLAEKISSHTRNLSSSGGRLHLGVPVGKSGHGRTPSRVLALRKPSSDASTGDAIMSAPAPMDDGVCATSITEPHTAVARLTPQPGDELSSVGSPSGAARRRSVCSNPVKSPRASNRTLSPSGGSARSGRGSWQLHRRRESLVDSEADGMADKQPDALDDSAAADDRKGSDPEAKSTVPRLSPIRGSYTKPHTRRASNGQRSALLPGDSTSDVSPKALRKLPRANSQQSVRSTDDSDHVTDSQGANPRRKSQQTNPLLAGLMSADGSGAGSKRGSTESVVERRRSFAVNGRSSSHSTRTSPSRRQSNRMSISAMWLPTADADKSTASVSLADENAALRLQVAALQDEVSAKNTLLEQKASESAQLNRQLFELRQEMEFYKIDHAFGAWKSTPGSVPIQQGKSAGQASSSQIPSVSKREEAERSDEQIRAEDIRAELPTISTSAVAVADAEIPVASSVRSIAPASAAGHVSNQRQTQSDHAGFEPFSRPSDADIEAAFNKEASRSLVAADSTLDDLRLKFKYAIEAKATASTQVVNAQATLNESVQAAMHTLQALQRLWSLQTDGPLHTPSVKTQNAGSASATDPREEQVRQLVTAADAIRKQITELQQASAERSARLSHHRRLQSVAASTALDGSSAASLSTETTAETAQLAEAVKRDQKTYADLLEDLTAHEEEIADLRAEIERRPRTVSDADSQLDVQSRMSLRKSLRSSGIFRKDLFAASPTHSTLTQGSDSGKQLLPTLAIGDLREDLQQEAATLCARLRDSLSTMRDGWQSGLKASLSFGEAQQRLERVGAGLVQLERDALRNRTVVLGTSVLELKNTVEARDTAVKQLTQKHSEARAETERLSTALNDREHELMSARERLNKLLHSMAEVQKAFDNQCAEMQTLRKDNTEKADDTARLSCLLEAERCSMLQANRRLQELQAHASDLEERLALIAGHYENCLRLASRSDPKDSMLALRLSPSYRTPGSLIGNGTLGLPSSEQLEKAEQSSSLSQKMQPAETPSEKSLTAPIIEQDVKATSSIDRAPTSSAQPVAAQADPQSVLMRNAQAVAALDETIRSLQERKQSLFRFARMDTKLSVTKRSAQKAPTSVSTTKLSEAYEDCFDEASPHHPRYPVDLMKLSKPKTATRVIRGSGALD